MFIVSVIYGHLLPSATIQGSNPGCIQLWRPFDSKERKKQNRDERYLLLDHAYKMIRVKELLQNRKKKDFSLNKKIFGRGISTLIRKSVGRSWAQAKVV